MKTSMLLFAFGVVTFAWGEVTTDASGNKTIDVQTGSETLDVYLNGNFMVTKTGAGTAILGLKNYKDNKYFGGTIDVQQGTLGATGSKSFGKPTAVSVASGATLLMQGGEQGYFHEKGTTLSLAGALNINSDTATAMLANLTLTGNATVNTMTAGSKAKFNGVLNSNVRTFNLGGYTLTKTGSGTVTFDHGTFVNTAAGGITQTGGTLELVDVGEVPTSDYNLKVYSTSVATAPKLVVRGATTLPTTTAQIGQASSYGSDYRYGIVEVGAGASVYNALGLGEDGYEILSVYQRGGYWQLPSGGGNKQARAPIGHSSMGYYEFSDGSFRTFGGSAALTIGNNAAGEGTVAMSGGVFESGVLRVGVSGDGLWYQTGGRTKLSKSVGKNEVEELLVSGTGAATGRGQVTLSGVNTVMNLGDGAYGSELVFGSTTATTEAILNLNDGASLVYYKLHKKADAHADSKFYLNFDGGVLKPGNNWQAIGADDTSTGKTTAKLCPDAVTIYEGGLTLDITKALNGSGNPDTTFIDCDLAAPTGGSIVSIEVPSSVKNARYIHCPRVYIEGDGQGASAVADFDSTTCRVKGVIVTSPGFGYTQANTTCKIADNSFQKQAERRANAVACTVAVGAVQGGGLRVIGAGNKQRLNLLGNNTYAGVTTLENASVKFDGAAAHPAGSGLDIGKGSEVRLTADIVAGSLAGQGEITGAFAVTGVTNLVVDAAALFGGDYTPLSVTGSVAFAPNATVTVTGLRALIDAAGDVNAFVQQMRNQTLLTATSGLTADVLELELPGLTDKEAAKFRPSILAGSLRFGRSLGMVVIIR